MFERKEYTDKKHSKVQYGVLRTAVIVVVDFSDETPVIPGSYPQKPEIHKPWQSRAMAFDGSFIHVTNCLLRH